MLRDILRALGKHFERENALIADKPLPTDEQGQKNDKHTKELRKDTDQNHNVRTKIDDGLTAITAGSFHGLEFPPH